MSKQNILFACFFACISLKIIAQEATPFIPNPQYSDNIKHREILVNMTPFVAQFVPFNANTLAKSNLFDFEYRRLKNGRGWRWSLGLTLVTESNFDEANNLYLRFGLIKRRQISNRFHFTRAWDVILSAESSDNFGRSNGKLGFGGAAFSYNPGVEFCITNRLSLSTEAILFMGILPDGTNNGGAVFRLIPPVGLFFHVKF
jgi:hypothetical protein